MGFGSTDEAASVHERISGKLMEEVKKTFNPEFLGRVDEILIFNPLGREQVVQIVDILMRQSMERLAEAQAAHPAHGRGEDLPHREGLLILGSARAPLRRTIMKYVEDPLSDEMLRGTFGRSATRSGSTPSRAGGA